MPARPRPRAGLLGLIAVPLLITGCGSAPAAQQAAASPATSTAAADTVAAAQYAANVPPAAAQMVCSEEIRGEVADALNLLSIPAPTSEWADHVYTCTYALPTGHLVLSVTVTPSDSAAGDQLETLRGRLPGAVAEPGLGEQAFGSPAGTVVSRKDNLVLTVDATGLPDDLGTTHESRLDFARVVTAGVFNCWTGNS
jgi:hypothetical protein